VNDHLREQFVEVLSGWPIGGGYCADKLATDDAREMADALLPVLKAYGDVRAAEALRAAAAAVQVVYEMQCPVRPPSHYMDSGAYVAHLWWQKVLGGALEQIRDRAAALASPAPALDAAEARGRAEVGHPTENSQCNPLTEETL
jgi:hypothetical protein